jgi:hypothetical protein
VSRRSTSKPLFNRVASVAVAGMAAVAICQATRPAFATGLQGTYSGTITGISGTCVSNRVGEQIRDVQVSADGTLTYSFIKVFGQRALVKGTVAPDGRIEGHGEGITIGGAIDPSSRTGHMSIYTGANCTWNVDLHL